MTTAFTREKENRKPDKLGMVCTLAICPWGVKVRMSGSLEPGPTVRETGQKQYRKKPK